MIKTTNGGSTLPPLVYNGYFVIFYIFRALLFWTDDLEIDVSMLFKAFVTFLVSFHQVTLMKHLAHKCCMFDRFL